MTGKDFSGPTPEIRAPVVPRLVGSDNEASGNDVTAEPSLAKKKKKSRTPSTAGDVVILGDIDTFEE